MKRPRTHTNGSMKMFLPAVVLSLLAIPLPAQDAKSNAAPASKTSDSAEVHSPGQPFPVSAGVIKPPFVLSSGYISQSTQTDVATDGKATYTFAITNAGDYVIQGLVNA